MNLKTNLLIVGTACALIFTGCRYRPNFGPQGTWEQQRARAQVSDPFPSNDLGPEIMGGRPRDFDRPAPEVKYLQDNPSAVRSKRGAFAQPYNGF